MVANPVRQPLFSFFQFPAFKRFGLKVTAFTSYFFTGSLAAAVAIVGWDLCSKSISLFIAERSPRDGESATQLWLRAPELSSTTNARMS